MKKTVRYSLQFLLLGLALFALPKLAYAWNIDSFHDDIVIQKDGSVIVTETIVANYSRDPHHGLLRDIPVNYRDSLGNNLSIDLTVMNVADEKGNTWEYTTNNYGRNIELKIGDPEKLLSKPSTFKITYRIDGAITYFADHDELYWNVTGNEWDTTIQKADATITLPAAVPADKIQVTCYTGITGSENKDCVTTKKENSVTIATKPQPSKRPALAIREGLTAVTGFPKGIVREPTATEKATRFIKNNWGLGLPFLVLLALFFMWYTRGRDPETSRNTIMPTFTPPENLTPGEVGTIVDEKVDMHDITATIIDLSIRGYMQIKEIKEKKLLFETTEYEFKKMKEFTAGNKLKPHEEALLDAIFGGESTKKLSDLKNKFYSDLPDIKNKIYNQVVADKYFPKNPEKIRKIYLGIGSAIVIAMIFGWGFLIAYLSLVTIIGIGISGALFTLFAKIMPSKSIKGVEAYYQILGLKEYINTAEKDRLKFQEKENIFEKLLPYAMVLGIAEKWTKAFEGIYKTPPSWYQSNDPNFMNHFSTYYLLSHINSAASTMNRSFTSSPRSAAGGGSGFSGGFSGGGFGGGGGGSW